MPDQEQTGFEEKPRQASENYDLVVIGAGMAGLNSLYAAVQYLPKGARVLLIDQKDAAGGMWNTAYDYVRLHQPHPMFTVGDRKWNLRKPKSYLPARDEVQAHLASALEPVAKKVSLSTCFGQTVSACREIKTDQGYRAEISYHPNDAPGESRTVRASRAIHAPGLNYRLASPLPLSSKSVVSIIPHELRETLAAHPKVPVVVVGGGKTGMDTILATLAEDPERKVSLIKGRGTNFLNRTKYMPTGVKRWTSGMLASRMFHDVATQFDGDNEDHTIAHFRARYSTDPATANETFLYALQSEEEHARIADGLSETMAGYLTDVTDTAEGPALALKDGSTQQVASGSIFVNCTGSLFRSELGERTPCLSPHDTVMTIDARDAFHFLTSVCGFFSTHLLYRGSLRNNGFYTLDHDGLFHSNRNAWVGASVAQHYMNQALAVQKLPMMLLDKCGLDLDRWYPLPRRMASLIKIVMHAEKDIATCRKALDRVAERFDVHCAELT